MAETIDVRFCGVTTLKTNDRFGVFEVYYCEKRDLG